MSQTETPIDAPADGFRSLEHVFLPDIRQRAWVIASAQRHELDVQLYLRSVLAHLPALPPGELQNYLPDVWKRDLMAGQQAALNAHHAGLAQVSKGK